MIENSSLEEAVMRDKMQPGSTPIDVTLDTDRDVEAWSIDKVSQSHWPPRSWEHHEIEDFLRLHQPDHRDHADAFATVWDRVQIDDILGYEDAHVHHLEVLGLDD